MSKGPGNIQRKLVAALEKSTVALDPFALAAKVYRLRARKDGTVIVNDAQLVSVRRALRGLERAGKAYCLGRSGRTQWASERIGLPAEIHRMQYEYQDLIYDGVDPHTLVEGPRYEKWKTLLNRAFDLHIRY